MFHNGALNRSIRKEAAVASTRNTCAMAYFPDRSLLDEPNQPDPRAAKPQSTIKPIAVVEAIKLNQLCSTSLSCVKRKFSVGSKPDERACEIFTQRCS